MLGSGQGQETQTRTELGEGSLDDPSPSVERRIYLRACGEMANAGGLDPPVLGGNRDLQVRILSRAH